MNTVTLRIKKKYFDAIASGQKKTEYREVKSYYERLFEARDVRFLKLHYQSTRQLTIEVKRVRRIRETRASELYAIDLGRIVRLVD